MPTVGFNVESVKHRNVAFECWDLGGQTQLRSYWQCYLPNTRAIVFVVDAADRERIDIARTELHKLLAEDELNGAPVLVFANKMDQPRAMDVGDVAEALELTQLKDRPHMICACCAVRNEGLTQGFDWLADAVSGNK
ncbi:MAG: hypothetical protein MHM6MM_005005 [Cercozoa sp. M6MM]